MLRTYGPDCNGSIIDPSSGTIPPGATWIDLEDPTPEEEKLVERWSGSTFRPGGNGGNRAVEPPVRAQRRVLHHAERAPGVNKGHPEAIPISFVLAGNRLVTVRYATPKPVSVFAEHIQREPELARDA